MGERDTRIVEVAGSNPVASTKSRDGKDTQGAATEGSSSVAPSPERERWTGKETQPDALKSEAIRQGAAKESETAAILAAWPKLGPEAQLLALEGSRGLPLVWQTDNGGCYVAEEVQAYLQGKKVVHLRSLPRTPEHNAYAESGIGELKAASRLGRGVVLASVEGAAEHLGRVSRRLDAHRLRASRGWKTSDQLDACMKAGYNVDRDRFYARIQECKARAVQGACSTRKARQAEREAVYAVLEEFGLVSRLRGGRPISVLKPGDNS